MIHQTGTAQGGCRIPRILERVLVSLKIHIGEITYHIGDTTYQCVYHNLVAGMSS